MQGGFLHNFFVSNVLNFFHFKVWRNPFNLFRGSEYQRFFWATSKEPLTFYDMNLSAQDHQTFFNCDLDAGKPDYEMMQTAWR